MLKCVELQTRNMVYVREQKIAAVQVIKSGWPSRIIFVGGGYVDVCGAAEIWKCELELVDLKDVA